MEDFKWILKKYGPVFLILFMGILAIFIISSKRNDSEINNTEEVWEPSVVIESSTNEEETETEAPTETQLWESTEPVSILTDEEEKQLQDNALVAAEKCRDLYENIEIMRDVQTAYPQMEPLTKEQRKDVVERLGYSGFVSVSEDINMENNEKVEKFCSDFSAGNDAQVTIFDVYQEDGISSMTFTSRGGKIQSYYVKIGWKEQGIPEIRGTGINDVKEIKLSEKGYFIYTNEVIIAHGNLREYMRVKPLSDECRNLTEKYISGLSYVNYNMLSTNWDSSNVEEILMPCMFEDLYRIYTGENLKTENWKIPAETYEQVMTTCFPVTVEQLRKHCGYDENSNRYEYEMIFAQQFPPFGEVVDYTENGDGTITLFVDGVWPDYNSDYAFTSQIVVQPFEDGTFRYVSNSIEQKELDIPTVE